MDCCKKECCSSQARTVPAPLNFRFIDYLKVLYSWIFSFRRTFMIDPGLYYTGAEYSTDAPLLVTCNYHMTVFILWRVLRLRNVRLLVIDTEGINVWCSSGKGRFSAEEIMRQLNRYSRGILTDSDKVSLVLPKLSLSGVSLARLRENSIEPKIGPVYARDLPGYLDDLPLKNRNRDRFLFSLRDRLFTLVPSLAQIFRYGLYTAAGLFAWHYFFDTGIFWQVIPVLFIVVVMYVLFFPVLPSRKFVLKGLALYGLLAAAFVGYYLIFPNSIDPLSLLFYMFFTGGACLFFSLSYTGNSGVSNYSLVKEETIRFLPVTAVFLTVSVITIIIKGIL